MNIRDTFDAVETKMAEIDNLLNAYNDAEGKGERFKSHGIVKDAEKLADEMLKLAIEMDDSDLADILQEDEEAAVQYTSEFLTAKAQELTVAVAEYAELCKDSDDLAARRKLKEIQKMGHDIAHVTEIS